MSERLIEVTSKFVETMLRTPRPIEYEDFGSSTRNQVLSPNNGGRVTGHRLKVDPADPNQGVFFVDQAGNATAATQLMRNKPGELIFMVPALPSGDYRLEVRADFGSDLRHGALPELLTVS